MKFQKFFLIFFALVLFSKGLLAGNLLAGAKIQQNIEFDSSELQEIKSNFAKPLYKIGSHNLKVFGFKVYYIELLSESPQFSYQKQSAILIKYRRDFAKEKLVERSISEMSRINNIKDQEVLNNYKNILEKIFCDVKKGDRKVAIFNPKFGLKLYFNGNLIGEITDKIFAQRFFDIWLSEKSSFPKMTADLLNSK